MRLTDEQILAKMVKCYRDALDKKERNRDNRIPWHNQLCGRPDCNTTAELHNSARLGHDFEWNDEYFEAADAANRGIAWLET